MLQRAEINDCIEALLKQQGFPRSNTIVVVDLCEIGGRIMHLLPVNNLNGHGFWQFSSDLIHSLYCGRNGFGDTKVYYASSIDPRTWYEMPVAKSGMRVEIVPIEPIILLSVTHKIVDVAEIEVASRSTLLPGRQVTYRSRRTGRGCQPHSGRASSPSCRAAPNWGKFYGTYPFFMVWPLVLADMRSPADANEKSTSTRP
jgi:hypothetical protein